MRPHPFASTFLASMAIIALFIAPAPAAATVDIAPGQSATLNAEGCQSATGGLLGETACPSCVARCDLPNNVAETELQLSDASVGKKYATASIYSDFTVSSTPATRGNAIQATISYDVFWQGGWTLTGVATNFNDAKMTLSLELIDLATSTVIHTEAIHTQTPQGFIGIDILETGSGVDDGSQQSGFAATLQRGTTYRLRLKSYSESKGALNAFVDLDYLTGPWGAGWNDLEVQLAPDLAEVVAGLQTQIDSLRFDLEHHRHIYLTGKGIGHNNTEALTGMAIFFDDSSSTDPDSTVLPEVPGTPLPTRSSLDQNYPNPFNPTTTVSFAIPKDSHVTISLYNAAGQKVATLLDADRTAGEHKVTLDAAGLASGVYFYRLVAGDFVETRKMVIVK